MDGCAVYFRKIALEARNISRVAIGRVDNAEH
jgi:hypothetical protein